MCALRADDPRDRDELVLKNLPRLSQVTDVSTASLLHVFAETGLQEWQGFDARLDAEEIAALGARSRRDAPVRRAADEPGLTPDDDVLLAPLAADGRPPTRRWPPRPDATRARSPGGSRRSSSAG